MARGDKAMIRSFLHPMYDVLDVRYIAQDQRKGILHVTFDVKLTKPRKTKR